MSYHKLEWRMLILYPVFSPEKLIKILACNRKFVRCQRFLRFAIFCLNCDGKRNNCGQNFTKRQSTVPIMGDVWKLEGNLTLLLLSSEGKVSKPRVTFSPKFPSSVSPEYYADRHFFYAKLICTKYLKWKVWKKIEREHPSMSKIIVPKVIKII